MLIITRADFQKLALVKLQEAEILLNRRKYNGAYYLCGYVIEFALKACIAKKLRRYQFPDLQYVRKVHTHDPRELIVAADLLPDLTSEMKTNTQFGVFWGIVIEWSEQSRYRRVTRKEAEDLHRAVSDSSNGVFQWIRRRW
jgi:hypothetical protein